MIAGFSGLVLPGGIPIRYEATEIVILDYSP
jgi:hypothetical protein